MTSWLWRQRGMVSAPYICGRIDLYGGRVKLCGEVVLYTEVIKTISNLFIFFDERISRAQNTSDLEVYARVKYCCLCCLLLAYFCFVS